MSVKKEYTTVLLMTDALTPTDRTAVQVKQVTMSEMTQLCLTAVKRVVAAKRF